MSWLLDTNVVSELRKSPDKLSSGVRTWAEESPPTSMYVSAISILEIERGVQMKERLDPTQGNVLRRWLEQRVLSTFQQRILPVDGIVARLAARYHVPVTAPYADALISASALHYGLTVVTHNVKDFERFDCPVFDPWNE